MPDMKSMSAWVYGYRALSARAFAGPTSGSDACAGVGCAGRACAAGGECEQAPAAKAAIAARQAGRRLIFLMPGSRDDGASASTRGTRRAVEVSIWALTDPRRH